MRGRRYARTIVRPVRLCLLLAVMALLFAPAAAGAGAEPVAPERLSAAVLAPDGDAVARAVAAPVVAVKRVVAVPVLVAAAAALLLAACAATGRLRPVAAAPAPVAVRGRARRRRGPPAA